VDRDELRQRIIGLFPHLGEKEDAYSSKRVNKGVTQSKEIIPLGTSSSGEHWSIPHYEDPISAQRGGGGSIHFTDPSLKPQRQGYTFYGENQGFGGLERGLIEDSVREINTLHPNSTKSRETMLNPRNWDTPIGPSSLWKSPSNFGAKMFLGTSP